MSAPRLISLLSSDVAASFRRRLQDQACWGLRRRFPDLSVRGPGGRWQIYGGGFCLLILVLTLALAPAEMVHGVVQLCAAGFLVGGLMRAALAFGTVRAQASAPGAAAPLIKVRQETSELPEITVLLPLYHEAEMLPGLVHAMQALVYPAGLLHFFLLTEAVDRETRAAAMSCARDSRFTVLEIPEGGPRTKPRACNYALSLVQSPYVVIFDAEDRPAPDQLLKAMAAFSAEPDLCCAQARLVIDNEKESWISTLFALDYRIWYGAILPGFYALGLPMPLGGSSNYFRTRDLRALGGWDAFNVTEDADLGVRMARFGFRARVFDSVTWESAPVHFCVWLRQRTRWLKGYMQTLRVHTRHPLCFARQCGGGGVCYLMICMAGSVASALLTPLLWLIFLCSLYVSDFSDGWVFAALAGGLSYVVNFCVALRAQAGRLRVSPVRSVLQILSMPFYWAMISVAAWRALLQCIFSPYLWEKTPHCPRA